MSRPGELAAFFSRAMRDIVADGALRESIEELLDALERGELRAAERLASGEWAAIPWIKTGILAGFKSSETVEMKGWRGAVDKATFPLRELHAADGVRVVPGGAALRRGAFVAPGAVLMPPSYVNVGARVGAGTMVDSHALVGSCAQVGERVHLSAGAQVGGVLEPANALPVIVEDDCFVGALSGLFEGVVMRKGAVLAPGAIVTASTTLYDLVYGRELRGEVPERAVVVPGSRPASGTFAAARGLQLYAPCIVKYRDASTDAATALEEALR